MPRNGRHHIVKQWIQRDRTWLGSLCFSIFLLHASLGLAQEGGAEQPARRGKPTLRANPLPADFDFTGKAAGTSWWAASDSIADLVTIEPEEGGVPAGQTIVRVFANQDYVVVGVRCLDDKPEEIVSFSKARDSDLENEDHIVIVFDTFQDGRSGYVFAVNPNGARFDGLVVDRDAVNSDWDAVWEAKTSRDSTGWSAEIRIPILSLRFKKDLHTWGFNVQRRVQRLQETSRWSGVSIDYWIYQTSRAGLLTDLPDFELGMGLDVRTSVVGRTRGIPSQPGPGIDVDTDGEVSLDLTQKMGPNLSSALTVNTDFAETEVDVRQINLTRFDIFFPEKRAFFLEGADIFEFGLGLDEESLLPFYSRRIGLIGPDEEEQVEVPINVGGKIAGQVGKTNIAGLLVNTRDSENLQVDDLTQVDVPQTTMGSLRVNQDILEESSVGMLATFGDQAGRSGSWVGGVDFTLQTTTFRKDKNLVFGGWGMLNDRSDLAGDKSAHGFRIEYPNDLWDANLTSMHIGNGFDPSLGFVPRNDVHIWDFGLEVNPRPGWSFLRQMFYELSGTLFNTTDNSSWESYGAAIKPFDWLLESGDRFDAGFEPEGDRPPEPFEVASDVDIAAGSYQWMRTFLGYTAAEKRRIGGYVRWDFGSYYSGDVSTIEAALTLRPSALWTLELTGERSKGDVLALIDDYEEKMSTELVNKHFTEEVYGIRLQLNLTADLQFSSLTQYDTQSRELGTNNRLRWTFNPLGDLFVVYNHNALKPVSGYRWEFVSNEFPVKIQYGWRF